ncbi:MAG: electron transport complex protein RnfG [Marinilabiliales bacterium]|nr:MAG: electron transport complex protein RnfG [Marinilabiliales bacterium]
MEYKVEITVCLGSSCFSRKNRDIVSVLQEFIANNKLDSEVYLKGGHCFGKCSLGPIMIVNEDMYSDISPSKAVAIVKSYLNS